VTPGLFRAVSAPSRLRVLRRQLVEMVFGTSSLPATLPAAEVGYAGASYATVAPAEVSRVDRLVATLPRGGESRMHLIHPTTTPLDRLLIVWGGHGISYHDDTTRMDEMVQAALVAGFHVLGGCMVNDSYNEIPVQEYALLDETPVTITGHNMAALEADGVSGLRFFVEGVVQGINYCLSTHGFERVDMTGLSGGGWTTDFASAIDTRIRGSYPVFGSLPFELRTEQGEGDWEQLEGREWWTILGDEETLYALGCLDTGRRRVQFLGDSDPVFPVLTLHAEVAAYEAAVSARVPAGQHDVVIDTTALAHEYSDETVAAIMADLL
jgi:hypothetical protein